MLYNRIIDGAALSESQKLHDRIPERYRWHYWLWLVLGHPTNGSFEANPEKIHRDLYAYMFPSVKVRHVQKLILMFKRAKLLETWTESGKTWGFLIGNDKKGRVLGPEHRKRFKDLPPTFPGICRESTNGNVGTSTALRGEGLGIGEGGGSKPAADFLEGKEEMSKSEFRTLYKSLVGIWKEVKGTEGAVCPYPRKGWAEQFEDLARTDKRLDQKDPLSPTVLEKAFRLWANEAGDPSRVEFPIEDFVRNKHRYMLMAAPVPEYVEDPNVVAQRDEQISELAKKKVAAMNESGPVNTNETSADEFLATE